MAAKKTKGRQKIEMKRIENEDDRLISFSKRRSGIYKKASELVTLTGAEVGFVVFSPSGKPFSFGHPSVDSVINCFLKEEDSNLSNTHPLVEAHRKMRFDELTRQYYEMSCQLDESKEKNGKLKEKLKEKKSNGWWDAPIDELNPEELDELENKFEELKSVLNNQIMKNNNIGTSSSNPPINPY